jgi:hypothetical protein
MHFILSNEMEGVAKVSKQKNGKANFQEFRPASTTVF